MNTNTNKQHRKIVSAQEAKALWEAGEQIQWRWVSYCWECGMLKDRVWEDLPSKEENSKGAPRKSTGEIWSVMVPGKTSKFSFTDCARCGQDHKDLEFMEFINPCELGSAWAMCPNMKEPIILKVVELDDLVQQALDEINSPEEREAFDAMNAETEDDADRKSLAEAKEKNGGKPGTPLREAAEELEIKNEISEEEKFNLAFSEPLTLKLLREKTVEEMADRVDKEMAQVPCDGKTGSEWIKSFDLAKEGEKSQQRTAIYIPVIEGKPNVLDICKLALESCKTEKVEDYADSRKGLTNWESSYNADLVQQALDELNSIKP